MKFLISLAWKNLSRYRRRTVITAVAIAVGIALFIWIDSLLLGAEMETIRNLIYFETGPARIMQKNYWEEKDYMIISYYLKDPDAIQAALKKAGYESTQRISFIGNIMNLEQREGSFQIKMAGIDVKTDGIVFKLEDGIGAGNGRFLRSGEPEIIIGKDLAEDLDITLGDWVLVTTKTAGDAYGEAGSWDDLELKVVGLLSTPNPLINKGTAFIPLDYGKKRLMRGQGATDVIVNFPENADSENEVKKISSAIAGLPGADDWAVLDYKELAREFIMLATTKSGGSQIILLLFFIIAVIGISNTMLMAVFERVKEIGMMRAMGMKDSTIVWSFFLEATGIGFIGSLAGLVLGILLTAYMVVWGLDFSGMIEGMGNIGYRTAGVFKGWWNLDTMLQAFFMGIIISGLVSFIPALRAIKMQITECLRDK